MRRLLLMSDWMGGIDNASAILIPPMKEVRGFLRDPVNKTPENFMLMSLPGHLQSLIPVASIAPSATGLPRNEPPWIEPSHQEKKTQAKRKAGGSAKGRVKPIVAPSSQLVIAEEPPDEA